jgi:hypothetical protein
MGFLSIFDQAGRLAGPNGLPAPLRRLPTVSTTSP